MDKENVINTSVVDKNKNKATKDTKQKKKVSKEILEIFSKTVSAKDPAPVSVFNTSVQAKTNEE